MNTDFEMSNEMQIYTHKHVRSSFPEIIHPAHNCQLSTNIDSYSVFWRLGHCPFCHADHGAVGEHHYQGIVITVFGGNKAGVVAFPNTYIDIAGPDGNI